jgi:hypothetical protein
VLWLPGPAALTNPYVVRRDDFRRLIRWPNDGIEQERKKNLAGGPNCLGRIETNDPDTIAMTELLGGYPSKLPLSQIEPEGGPMEANNFFRTLPFMYQINEAQRQSDPLKAKKHLVEAYKSKDENVKKTCTRGPATQSTCRLAIDHSPTFSKESRL